MGVLVVLTMSFALVGVIPSHAGVIKVMPIGDSVTAGGTHAVDSYRYPLFVHFRDQQVSWQPVGPYWGVGSFSGEPLVGYSEWPEEWTRHAGAGGNTVRELSDSVRGWVSDHQPDLLIAFPGFVSQDTVTEEHLVRFIDRARLGRPDVKMLFGLPHYGSPHSHETTDAYRALLTSVVAAKDTETSPLRLVDVGEGWSEDYHGGGGTQGRYPAEPEGNRRVAMRWADALWRYWQIGQPWGVPAAPSTSYLGM
jgi:hypothetical protein